MEKETLLQQDGTPSRASTRFGYSSKEMSIGLSQIAQFETIKILSTCKRKKTQKRSIKDQINESFRSACQQITPTKAEDLSRSKEYVARFRHTGGNVITESLFSTTPDKVGSYFQKAYDVGSQIVPSDLSVEVCLSPQEIKRSRQAERLAPPPVIKPN